MVEFTKVKKCSSKEFELIKITDDVRRFAAQSKIKNGVVYVICLLYTSPSPRD